MMQGKHHRMMDISKVIFISYDTSDRLWAVWIADILRKAGYTVQLGRDFPWGTDYIQEWQDATTRATHTIMVLSSAYLQTLETQPPWTFAFAQLLKGKQDALLFIRIHDVELQGMFATRQPLDLFNVDKDTARRRLLEGISGIQS